MRVFFDSSGFAQRYVAEAGSERVQALCEEADAIVLSILTPVELVSGFCRLQREGHLEPQQRQLLEQVLSDDLAAVEVAELDPDVMALALAVLRRSGLGSLAALQVATALSQEIELFVTADALQAEAAQALGLVVEQL